MVKRLWTALMGTSVGAAVHLHWYGYAAGMFSVVLFLYLYDNSSFKD